MPSAGCMFFSESRVKGRVPSIGQSRNAATDFHLLKAFLKWIALFRFYLLLFPWFSNCIYSISQVKVYSSVIWSIFLAVLNRLILFVKFSNNLFEWKEICSTRQRSCYRAPKVKGQVASLNIIRTLLCMIKAHHHNFLPFPRLQLKYWNVLWIACLSSLPPVNSQAVMPTIDGINPGATVIAVDPLAEGILPPRVPIKNVIGGILIFLSEPLCLYFYPNSINKECRRRESANQIQKHPFILAPSDFFPTEGGTRLWHE